MPARQRAIARLKSLRIGSDVGLAFGVMALLVVLVLPLSPILLDFGLAMSITGSLLILMVGLFIARPLDFTSFPTLLLISTLLRLSLNVATSRLVLSHGNEGATAAGHVVAAFGGFLMGGDVLIGVIVFAILLVVNFMVITKGSSRIAEVAARFSLDSMPGKQMAIDAEMSSGAINETEARHRRRELEEENAFYGAMEGAAKFVRGDAIAGLIITFVNIIGGLLIGTIRHGMSVGAAFTTFTTLTVGDGLVSQIPALLVSVAAGIVVMKGGVQGTTDKAIVRQLGASPQALAIAAGTAALLALLPNMPALPFLAVAGLAGTGAWLRQVQVESGGTQVPAPGATEPMEPPIAQSLEIDTLRLELGYGLLSLVSGEGARLTSQIQGMRKALASEMGFVLPPVRIQDNMELASYAYCFRIKELEAGKGELRPGMLLAISSGGDFASVEGERIKEPAFGLPAVWISESKRPEALRAGCTVIDLPGVLITHLNELIRSNLDELLSYLETQKLLDGLAREHQRLVSELIPAQIATGGVQRVLRGLLQERVSIRDLPTILEGIQEAASGGVKAIPAILGHVRVRLSRQLSIAATAPGGYIPALLLSSETEAAFADAIVPQGEERHLALAPAKLHQFVQNLKAAYDAAGGEHPAVVCSAGIRQHVRMVVMRTQPAISVIAHTEIHPQSRLRELGRI